MVAKYRHHGLAGRARQPGHRLRRGPVRRRQHRDQQRPLPPAARQPRRRVAAHLRRSTSSRPPRSTATPHGSRASSAWPRSPARPRRRRPCSNGAPPSSAGATSSSPGCSATTPRAGARSRRCRARCCPRPWPRARRSCPTRRVVKLDPRRRRASSAPGAVRTHPGGGVERLTISADHVFVCGGAVHTPALLQRSGIRRNVGNGLKMHPTIKIAARFPYPLDHGDVPMHRVTEFSPFVAIGGSASRRGHIAMALADTGAPYDDALADWENVSIYYAAIRSEGSGRVVAAPGPAVAARHLLAHRGRPQPPGPRPRPPRRDAARRRRHRAAPVGRGRIASSAGSTSWAPGGTRRPGPAPTS